MHFLLPGWEIGDFKHINLGLRPRVLSKFCNCVGQEFVCVCA